MRKTGRSLHVKTIEQICRSIHTTKTIIRDPRRLATAKTRKYPNHGAFIGFFYSKSLLGCAAVLPGHFAIVHARAGVMSSRNSLPPVFDRVT